MPARASEISVFGHDADVAHLVLDADYDRAGRDVAIGTAVDGAHGVFVDEVHVPAAGDENADFAELVHDVEIERSGRVAGVGVLVVDLELAELVDHVECALRGGVGVVNVAAELERYRLAVRFGAAHGDALA